MSFSFTVLHISDLHERGPREGEPWRRRRVLGEAWLRNLDELRKDGPVDLICFTGDLAERGQPAEYAGPSRPVAVCALQGMPGVGKSYLCDHFAQQHADEFPGGYHRIVFSLGVTPTPEEKLAELAESLGIRGPVAALWGIVEVLIAWIIMADPIPRRLFPPCP